MKILKDMIKFGNKILRKKNRDVKNSGLPDSPPSIEKFLYAHNVEAICGPQIGHNYNYFLMLINDSVKFFLDPKIVSTKGKILTKETCKSLPNISVKIERFEKIRIEYLDLHMRERSIILKNEEAILAQKMIDLLNGILIIDYLSKEEYDNIGPEINSIERSGKGKSRSRRSSRSIVEQLMRNGDNVTSYTTGSSFLDAAIKKMSRSVQPEPESEPIITRSVNEQAPEEDQNQTEDTLDQDINGGNEDVDNNNNDNDNDNDINDAFDAEINKRIISTISSDSSKSSVSWFPEESLSSSPSIAELILKIKNNSIKRTNYGKQGNQGGEQS